MKKSQLVHIAIFAVLAGGLALFFFDRLILRERLPDGEEYGATFSPMYARELGLDPTETFRALLDDLKIRRFRIPLYWPITEPEEGKFDFTEMDAILDEAARFEAKVILVVGQRLPRYPECHFPEWSKRLSARHREEALLAYLRSAVAHYAEHPAVAMWQVENEPLFPYFGDCPKPDVELLSDEVLTVRLLSKKPIMITSSGEFGSWIREAQLGDVLGISLYRGAQFQNLGYVPYPTEPWFYQVRYWSTQPYVKKILISELQLEPWALQPLATLPVEDQVKSMNPKAADEALQFARGTGFREIYLWGVEWWYWMKTKQSKPEMWEWARDKFQITKSK